MTTLSDAEPGDTAIVAHRIVEINKDGFFCEGHTSFGNQNCWFAAGQIRSIEKTAKSLKVGDRVMHCDGEERGIGEVLAISHGKAFVDWDAYASSYRISDLTRV